MSYGYEALLSIEDELEALPTYQDPEPVPTFPPMPLLEFADALRRFGPYGVCRMGDLEALADGAEPVMLASFRPSGTRPLLPNAAQLRHVSKF